MTTDAEKAAEEWAKLSLGEVPSDRIIAPISHLTLWKRDKKMLEEGFLSGAAWAAPKWISVEERMPEPNTEVLAAIAAAENNPGVIVQAIFNGFQWKPLASWIERPIAQPSHWMPLPDAPKEEK